MVGLVRSTRYLLALASPAPPAPLPRSGFVLRPNPDSVRHPRVRYPLISLALSQLGFGRGYPSPSWMIGAPYCKTNRFIRHLGLRDRLAASSGLADQRRRMKRKVWYIGSRLRV